jgi:glyoxylase-like metal-dependent hydrolase (beta-lactamase superfamily II)
MPGLQVMRVPAPVPAVPRSAPRVLTHAHPAIRTRAPQSASRCRGNLDLFGDRRVEVLRVPGHTPGSQIMVARLPKTGTAVFTGDAVYLRDNLEQSRLPGPAGTWFAPAMLQGYQLIRHIRESEGAKVFYSHDGAEFNTYLQAPEYYE